MKQMAQFLNLYKQYKDKEVDFVIVYIHEAHAINRWKLEGNVKVNYHKTLQDRFEAFKLMIDNIVYLIKDDEECEMQSIQELEGVKFIIDSMDPYKNLDWTFNAYVERLVALKGNQIEHKFGGPGPVATAVNNAYSVNELEVYLKQYFEN